MFQKAKKILKIINDLGYDAYICGGCVRDFLLEEDAHDIDITTNCPMSVLENHFETYNIGQSKNFGLVCVKFEGCDFEVANFRTEGGYTDGRRPSEVSIADSFEEDSSRRDFTINSLAMCENEGILDYHGGMDDLAHSILKTVGNPFERMNEDYLRMLRAIRFAVKFDLSIDQECSEAMKSYSSMINVISKERIGQELMKMASFTGEKFAKCIELLEEHYILQHILPEISIMKKFKHGIEHHPEGGLALHIKSGISYPLELKKKEYFSKDYKIIEGSVFDHVMAALKQQKEKNNPVLNFCVLFHDIGKPSSFVLKGGIKKTFHGHDLKGSEMIPDICERLRFTNKMTNVIKFCALNHMVVHKFREVRPYKIAKRIVSPHFEMLMKTSFCDDSCRGDAFEMDNWLKIVQRVEDVKKKMSETAFFDVNGYFVTKIVMDNTGETISGPIVGKLIDKGKEFCVNAHNYNRKNLESFILSVYKSSKNS